MAVMCSSSVFDSYKELYHVVAVCAGKRVFLNIILVWKIKTSKHLTVFVFLQMNIKPNIYTYITYHRVHIIRTKMPFDMTKYI